MYPEGNVLKNLIKPDNEAEAIAMQAILEQHNIQAEIMSFRDTAYDGLFQHQYGWGVIKVKESDYLQAQQIIQEWKGAAPDKIRWDGDAPDPAR
jgi:type III secretory pathway lipoprotein EscJ